MEAGAGADLPKGVPVFRQEYTHLSLRPEDFGGFAPWAREAYSAALDYGIDEAATSAAFNLQRNKAALGIAVCDKPQFVSFS